MALSPYAAAKRTLSLADKLLEVNWGLMLLIVLIASAGFAMLYSVAGGHIQPWARRRSDISVLGLLMLLAAAMIDVRVWMSLGLSGLRLGAFASDSCGCGRPCRARRSALDHAGARWNFSLPS